MDGQKCFQGMKLSRHRKKFFPVDRRPAGSREVIGAKELHIYIYR